MNVVGLVVAGLMAVSILLIPLGLPGLWVMAALVGVGKTPTVRRKLID